MNSNYYRADIDGLRAIAVLGVILFHAGLGVKGGFVGVDVFLVISGYLITKIIAREFQGAGGFSLKRFWVRRIRRILPASVVVTLAALTIGYIVLGSTSYFELGKSVVAHGAMLANVFFWMSNDYFSEAAELQPLLHMWSLSVEEQFYFIYPLLLLLLFKKKRILVGTLTCITFLSLAASLIGVYEAPSATFYLLPTRAWELSAGGLLALTESRILLRARMREVLAVLGLLGILMPMLIYSEHLPFPGLLAVAPVAGSVVLILVNREGLTLIGRMLSKPILIAIGLASYSLYLWHWPVLVFFKHMFSEDTLLLKIVALLLTGALSFLSWRYIEIPFRNPKLISRSRSAFTLWAGTTFIMVVLGFVVYINKGFPLRFDSQLSEIHEDITWNGSDYSTEVPEGVSIGALNSSVDFVVWGDSHGMALINMIDSLAKEQGLTGAALLSAGRPPVTNLWKPVKGVSRQMETTSLNRSRLDWILSSNVKDVFLIARWRGMVEGLLDTEIDIKRGMPVNFPMVVDSPEISNPNCEQSEAALRRQLGDMIQELSQNDVRVWVLLQVPSASQSRVARSFYQYSRFPRLNKAPIEFDLTRSNYEKGRGMSVSLISEFEDERVHVIDPTDAFFEENQNLRLFTDRALYRDEDHLTRAGAEYYLKALFKELLVNIHFHD
jgi:peptidoglycan/LPS O-acetylase OafA/YrhL